MKVAVIGTGYVGLIAACCLAKSGHQTIAVIAERQSPIYEKGLAELLSNVLEQKTILFTKDLSEA